MNSHSFSHIGEVAIAPRTEENDGRQGCYFPTATTGERPSYSQQPDPEDRMTAGGGGAVRSGSDFGEKIGQSHSFVEKQGNLQSTTTSVGYYDSVAPIHQYQEPCAIEGSINRAHESAEVL